MSLTSLISVVTLAIISKNATCEKNTDIDFVEDFVTNVVSKSVTLIGFLCWNEVEKSSLLGRLSRSNIISSIYNVHANNIIEYSQTDGSSLYLVDLDCDKSTNIISLANNKHLFDAPNRWVMLTTNKDYTENIDYFATYNFSVDSDIILALKIDSSNYKLYEIYKYDKISEHIRQAYITQWTYRHGFENFRSHILPEHRRNLNGTVLRASVVILNNETFNHLTDYRYAGSYLLALLGTLFQIALFLTYVVYRRRNILYPVAPTFKHIDTITKVNYIFTNHIFDYVNGSREFIYVPTWGYFNKETNFFTGMIGSLQRNEAELGGTPLFLTYDRVKVIEYIAMTTPTRAKFIFRQPPLSYVTNVFTLPFSGDVWLSSLGLCFFASILLYIAVSVEWKQSRSSPQSNSLSPSLLDTVMLTIGAVAQQGTTSEPKSGAGRTIMILTFTALMFLYVSYSANIVALLQSSATNIRTLEDLLLSRLSLGVDDNVYNHYYFPTATEPIRKAIYEKKVAPKGQKQNFMKIEEGVARLREGFFAFHGEQGQVYKLVGDTFYESEKCGIQEIQYLQVVEPYYAIKKNSSYKELFKLGLRKIHESGIQSRELQRLYTKKPDCHTSGGNFVSVGLIDSYPAFLVLGSGMSLSVLLFLIEKATYKRLNY